MNHLIDFIKYCADEQPMPFGVMLIYTFMVIGERIAIAGAPPVLRKAVSIRMAIFRVVDEFLLTFLCFYLAGLAVLFAAHKQADGIHPLAAFYWSPVIVVPALVGAVRLYRMRRRSPFAYGLIEVTIAVGVTVHSALNTSISVTARAVALAASVYFVVRGLDNMEKGLPVRFRAVWDWAFPQQPLADPSPAPEQPLPTDAHTDGTPPPPRPASG
jgi:hypothetical protein